MSIIAFWYGFCVYKRPGCAIIVEIQGGFIMSARMSRLDIRTTKKAKEVIESAANAMGVTLSAFILECAMEKASEVLEKARRISLSREESERFFDLIENPPAANENLKRLFETHKKK